MEFIKNLYLEPESINILSTISMVKKRMAIFNTYLICIDKNNDNNISEILPSHEIYKLNNSNKKYICIGIAVGKQNAFNLFSRIVQNYIDSNVNFQNFKNYFD
jgi:hypothetical protein